MFHPLEAAPASSSKTVDPCLLSCVSVTTPSMAVNFLLSSCPQRLPSLIEQLGLLWRECSSSRGCHPAPRQGKEESSGAIASAVARSERIPGTLRIAHMTGRRLLQDPPDGLPGTAQFLPEDVAGLKTFCPRDIGAKVPALSLNAAQ